MTKTVSTTSRPTHIHLIRPSATVLLLPASDWPPPLRGAAPRGAWACVAGSDPCRDPLAVPTGSIRPSDLPQAFRKRIHSPLSQRSANASASRRSERVTAAPLSLPHVSEPTVCNPAPPELIFGSCEMQSILPMSSSYRSSNGFPVSLKFLRLASLPRPRTDSQSAIKASARFRVTRLQKSVSVRAPMAPSAYPASAGAAGTGTSPPLSPASAAHAGEPDPASLAHDASIPSPAPREGTSSEFPLGKEAPSEMGTIDACEGATSTLLPTVLLIGFPARLRFRRLGRCPSADTIAPKSQMPQLSSRSVDRNGKEAGPCACVCRRGRHTGADDPPVARAPAQPERDKDRSLRQWTGSHAAAQTATWEAFTTPTQVPAVALWVASTGGRQSNTSSRSLSVAGTIAADGSAASPATSSCHAPRGKPDTFRHCKAGSETAQAVITAGADMPTPVSDTSRSRSRLHRTNTAVSPSPDSGVPRNDAARIAKRPDGAKITISSPPAAASVSSAS